MLPFCHRVIQPVMAIVIPLTIFHIATKGLVRKVETSSSFIRASFIYGVMEAIKASWPAGSMIQLPKCQAAGPENTAFTLPFNSVAETRFIDILWAVPGMPCVFIAAYITQGRNYVDRRNFHGRGSLGIRSNPWQFFHGKRLS